MPLVCTLLKFANFRERSPELLLESPFACICYTKSLQNGVLDLVLDSFAESSRTSPSLVWFGGTIPDNSTVIWHSVLSWTLEPGRGAPAARRTSQGARAHLAAESIASLWRPHPWPQELANNSAVGPSSQAPCPLFDHQTKLAWFWFSDSFLTSKFGRRPAERGVQIWRSITGFIMLVLSAVGSVQCSWPHRSDQSLVYWKGILGAWCCLLLLKEHMELTKSREPGPPKFTNPNLRDRPQSNEFWSFKVNSFQDKQDLKNGVD